MTFNGRRVSCIDLFKHLKIMTVHSLYIYKCLIYVKENMKNFTVRREFTGKHNLRPSSDIIIPTHRLSLTSKSPKVMPLKLYNNLPNFIKNTAALPIFQKKLKQYLLENPFYSVEQFMMCSVE